MIQLLLLVMIFMSLQAKQSEIQHIKIKKLPSQLKQHAEQTIPSQTEKTLSQGDEKKTKPISYDEQLSVVFNDPELQQREVSINSKKCGIQELIELIGLSSQLDFIIDPKVTGTVGKINVENKQTGELLRMLCENNVPRLMLTKHINMWRVMLYDDALLALKQTHDQELETKVFHLKHIRCDEVLQKKIDDMWARRINKHQQHEDAYCVLDIESKKVFVRAHPKQIHEVEFFIKEIDCRQSQVRIDALVALVDRKYESQLGFNWFGAYNRQSTINKGLDIVGIGSVEKGNAGNFALNLFTQASPIKVPFVFGGPNLNIQHITAELCAAETESKVKILLRPSVLTSHNETAEILIGKSIPIKTFFEDIKLREKVHSVNYKDVGTILNVTPLVTPDRQQVMLNLLVEDSVVVEQGSVEQAPAIKTIRTKNKVVLKSGQTTVIGGLMLNRDEHAQSEVPGIAKIPIIGNLFKSRTKRKEDNQLLIFITPTIVS